MQVISSYFRQPWGVAAVVFSLAMGGGTLHAQPADSGPPEVVEEVSGATAEPEPSDPMAAEVPGVTVVEHLGDQVPLDLSFVDENGKRVKLGDYTSNDKPIILTLNYYRCPMLCGLVLNGLAQSVKEVSLAPGTDYQIVTVSFDPAETPSLARLKKDGYVRMFEDGRDPEMVESGWAFLTGEQQNIEALSKATGFGYQWVESRKQYAHPAAIILLSPDGKITRYLYGIEFDPDTLRLSLVEASDGQIGSTTDRFLLTCFHFDPDTGKYSRDAMFIMRVGGVLVVLLLAGTIGVLLLRERRRRSQPAHATP